MWRSPVPSPRSLFRGPLFSSEMRHRLHPQPPERGPGPSSPTFVTVTSSSLSRPGTRGSSSSSRIPAVFFRGRDTPTGTRNHLRSSDSGTTSTEAVPSAAQSLLSTLPANIRERLAGGRATLGKLRIKFVEDQLHELSQQGFPLPSELNPQQWERMLMLTEEDLRVRYLDAIATGREDELFPSIEWENRVATDGVDFAKILGDELEDGERLSSERLQKIQNIYDEMRQNGHVVPLVFEPLHKKELAEATGKQRLSKIFEYLGRNRRLKLSSLVEKRARQATGKDVVAAIRKDREAERHLIYGLSNNTILLRYYPSVMDLQESWYVAREFNSWGQPLVIDLAFVGTMDFKEAKSFAHMELPHALKVNRSLRTPFAIHLCNFNPKCEKCQLIHHRLTDLCDPAVPVVCTEKSYLDLFPEESLVYLSPDSKLEMGGFDHDAVYIIGGLVDTTRRRTLTLPQAKKEGIRHRSLPMRRHVGIKADLNVDHVVGVLGDLRASRDDWLYSLRWTPPRYFKNRLNSSLQATLKDVAIYLAHRDLTPANPDSSDAWRLTPREYRRRYSEYLTDRLDEAREEMERLGLQDTDGTRRQGQRQDRPRKANFSDLP